MNYKENRDDVRTEHLHIRATKEEREKIEENARRAGMPVSRFLRNAALKEEE